MASIWGLVCFPLFALVSKAFSALNLGLQLYQCAEFKESHFKLP